MRNLEQIQESDGESRTPRAVTVLLVALGGACVVFAGLALGGRRAVPNVAKPDPLGELVTQQAKGARAQGQLGKTPGKADPAADLNAHDVTFPGILSDEGSPTTALAAVKGNAPTKGAETKQDPKATEPTGAIALNVRPSQEEQAGSPPPATDRLPVVPLPAQHVLEASPVVTRPRDVLTRAATDAAQLSGPAEPAAPPGREGGYQLQVSSFRTMAEGEQFAAQLRARGHKAYVVEAHVPGRGTWFRVRIGPFASQQAAASYRSGFEGREHVVPFIVQPQNKSER